MMIQKSHPSSFLISKKFKIVLVKRVYNRQLLVSKITMLRTFPILMCAGMDPGQYFSFFCPYSHIIISLYA